MIEISQLRMDGGTQSRAAINEATVSEYAEAMADPTTVFPPVTVYFDGRDYWLADGFHRVAAWERTGRMEIPAEIRQGDRRRAILHSVAANSAHGLRRTNDDKRRAVLTLLEDAEWGQWSDREIAKRCGVSHPYVASVRADLSGNGFQMAPTRTVERGGTVYQQNTANIGAGSRTDQEPITTKTAAQPVEQAEQAPVATVLPSPPPEPVDQETAKARRELAKLTPDALIDDLLAARAATAAERVKRKAAEAKVSELEDQVKAFEADHEMGAKLGEALRQITKTNGRLKEVQTQLARETRRANHMEKERNDLRAKLEGQIIRMDGAA